MDVDVTLTSYPLGGALAANLATTILLFGLLLAGTFLFWSRPREITCRAALVIGATVSASVTAYPLGLGAIDLAGSRGVWPLFGGELLLTVGIGSMLLAALTFPWTRAWLLRRSLAWLVPFLVPVVAYLLWVVVYAGALEPDAARLQALLMVSTPALLMTVPLIVVVEARGLARARNSEDRMGLRLVLLGTLWAAAVRLFLGDLPQQLNGEPLVPWQVQALLLIPPLLMCFVGVVLRYRLQAIDGLLSRSLLQVVVVTLVQIAPSSSVVAAAVDLATNNPFSAVVAGGLVALGLVPLALALRRTVAPIRVRRPGIPVRGGVGAAAPRSAHHPDGSPARHAHPAGAPGSASPTRPSRSTHPRPRVRSRPPSAPRAVTRPRSCSRWAAPPSGCSSSR